MHAEDLAREQRSIRRQYVENHDEVPRLEYAYEAYKREIMNFGRLVRLCARALKRWEKAKEERSLELADEALGKWRFAVAVTVDALNTRRDMNAFCRSECKRTKSDWKETREYTFMHSGTSHQFPMETGSDRRIYFFTDANVAMHFKLRFKV